MVGGEGRTSIQTSIPDVYDVYEEERRPAAGDP
jgi:hypothetical protein